jgi:hypothetical protein
MGQDSWNLQYGNMHAAKYRRGTHVDMHPDEGWAGPKMVPGYAGAYKNWKGKVIGEKPGPKNVKVENRPGYRAKGVKPDGNPWTFGPSPRANGGKRANEVGVVKPTTKKRRK